MERDELIRDIQARYQSLGEDLNERQRRLWAAAEAIRLGRGGIAAISKALRISPNTIKRGMQEIRSGQASSESNAEARVRRTGGGRKPKKKSANPPESR